MFNRFSLFTKFLILASTLFAILATVLILTSNFIIKSSFINRSKSAVASAVSFEAKDLQAEDFSLTDPEHTKEVFNSFYERVKTAELLRIKVWDYSAKVIFSDDESIVGKRFPDNDEFKEALKGELVTEIGQKTKSENISEQDYERLLEVYIPITFKGENIPSGVIEAYFKLDNVNERIRETRIILSAAIVTFTMVSFGLFFMVFRLIIYKQIEKINLQAVALDNASDHVIITDSDGVILYVNEAAERLTGYSRSEMIGNRPSLWGKQMPKEFYEKMWRTIKTDKKAFEGQITNRRKNGEEYAAETKISPVLDKNNNITFFVGIERDITKEKEIDRAKTEFVSLVSHQLSTPLTTINWYLEMLLSGGEKTKLNNDQKEYVEEASLASKRMVGLVNALLNVSRIEMGTFIVEPKLINIAEILKTVVSEFEHQINEKKLEVTQEYDPAVPNITADPKHLGIVAQNLLENAINYTPSGGKIKVSLKGRGSDILIAVEDTGIGIPKIQQPKIFIKMFRADNVRAKQVNGIGLGLYMTKSIVDHSGGKIWFESEEGKGTTFYITIPISGMKAKEGTKSLT